MATQTTNFGFEKPAATDKLSVLVNYNGNLDLIDSTIKRVSDAATTASSTATAAQSTATAAQTAADAAQSTATAAGTAAAAAASAATAAQSTADSKAAIDDTAAAATTTYSSDKIETELATKQATITGAATTIVDSNLTTNRALISNSTGKVETSSITSTQLGYLSGVTSNIQTQLNNKDTKGWTHLTSLTATTSSQTYTNSVLASADMVLIIVHGPSVIMGQPAMLPAHFQSTMVGSKTLFFSDPTLSGHNVTIGLASDLSINYYKSSASSATVEIYYK